MQNWFAIETEVRHRHEEWTRAATAEARVDQAAAGMTRPRLPRPALAVPGLERFASARLALVTPYLPRRRTAPC